MIKGSKMLHQHIQFFTKEKRKHDTPQYYLHFQGQTRYSLVSFEHPHWCPHLRVGTVSCSCEQLNLSLGFLNNIQQKKLYKHHIFMGITPGCVQRTLPPGTVHLPVMLILTFPFMSVRTIERCKFYSFTGLFQKQDS